MGAISIMKTEKEKVTCETAEGSVININFNQRTCLDCMLDAIKAIRMKRKEEKGAINDKPVRETGSALTLRLGVSFITLGFICVGLAVLLAVAESWLALTFFGTHFWVGFPFIVSGALNVVAYRHPKPIWKGLTVISLLTCLAVSIPGLAFSISDIRDFPWRNNECDSLVRALQNRDRYGYYDEYDKPTPSYYYNNNNNYNYELESCKRVVRQSKIMLFGVVILSFLIMVWGIFASLVALGYAACNAYKRTTSEEEDNDEPILSPNPPSDIIIA